MIKGLIVSMLLLTGVSSFAQSVETVVVNVDFQISKCEYTNTTASCDMAASLGSNQSISLTNCSSSGGATFCSGSWTKSLSRDGYPFDAYINATKTTWSDGTSYYSYDAGVGPTLSSNSIPHTSVQISSNDGKINNCVRFSSASLPVGNDTTYTPSLLVCPERPNHP